MQKIIPGLIITAAFVAAAPQAKAAENVYRPYLGAAYSYDIGRARGYHSFNNSGALILGSTYNPYFSTELFYQYSDQDNGSRARFQGYGLDALAYLPLGCEGTIAPVSTIGIGEYSIKTDYRLSKDRRDRGYGYRFGGGLRYNLNDRTSLTALVRHIELDHIDKYDHLTEYSLAVKYIF